MFRYVDALCLLPLTMYPKTHTRVHAHARMHTHADIYIKSEYLKKGSKGCKGNTLFRVVNKVLHTCPTVLPDIINQHRQRYDPLF